jgi:hypothetical protein
MVLNSHGVQVLNIEISPNTHSVIIPVIDLSTGLYLGKLVSEKGAVHCFRFQVTN